MKKLYTLVICCLLLSDWVAAQPYGNEWINFSTNQPHSIQQYFKISVWRDGVYRVTLADLQAAQFPSPFNPKQLQLFHNGKEQFIRVEGEADGVFDPTDFIEFYGIKNDGTVDTRLYKNPDWQVNKALSLFTDTAAYFLTLNANPLIVNKRMVLETDVNFIGYTPLPYCIRESFSDYKVHYNTSKIIDVADPEYDEGEGWYDVEIQNSPATYFLAVPNASNDPSAPIAQASSVVMGGNYDSGNTHQLTLDVNGALQTLSFTGFAVNRFAFPLLNNNSLAGGTATFLFTPLYIINSGIDNWNHVSFIKLAYPHTFSFAGESFNFRKLTVPGNLSPNKSLLNFTNLNLVNPRLFMFSDDTLKQVTMSGSGNTWQALVPTYNSDKVIFLSDSIYTSANGHLRIAPVSINSNHFARFINYLYISNADYLIVTHESLMGKADQYSSFRASTGFTPLVVDIEELYNQFAYGVVQHPSSIQKFCEFTKENFVMKPEYLLIIGKSVASIHTRSSPSNWNKNLVPTYGYPASDMLFGSLITDTLPRAEIAVGRISASTTSDVQAYFDKITVHEQQMTQCPKEWMKQVLHFGGGNNAAQRDEIEAILDGFQAIAEDTLMGANVHKFLKTSSDPIQVNLTQYLQALIDSGSTIMTFVAHASGTTFDISTDIPQNYNNQDKYPIVIANSCFVGDIHDPLRRIAEDFVLLPNKGSIGFIAQPSVGYLPNLKDYTGYLYDQIARSNYGGKIGKSIAHTIDSVYASPQANSSYFSYYLYKSVCAGMTLSGDPALVLNSFDKADYQITDASLFFTPASIASDLDSFEVNIVIKNLGKVVNQPFAIHLKRTFPASGGTFEMDTIVGYVAYADTITIKLAVDPVKGVGVNTFDVSVDYNNIINECRDDNNFATEVLLQINSSDIVPVYPAEFSIVPNGGAIELKASTLNPFNPVRPYAFQIDTVDTFNSPAMAQAIVTSPGGIVKWQIPFSLVPDRVYYWRVSRDSMPGDTIHPLWKESSFIHKPALTGWSQAHYSQFKKDSYSNIVYSNTNSNTFSFVTNNTQLMVRNFQWPNQLLNPFYEINNAVIDYQMCSSSPSMHIVVLDSITLQPWSTDQYTFGNHNLYNPNGPGTCNRTRPEYYFIFLMNDPASRDSMFDMLQNDIPPGNYVIAYSVFGGNYTTWSPSLKQVFTDWGSTLMNTSSLSNNSQPYIFFTKKGDNTFTDEIAGDSLNPVITLNKTLGGNWNKGFVNSAPIGPAVTWDSLHWHQEPVESTPQQDSSYVDIIGIQSNGIEVPLVGFQGIPVGTPDLSISSIDPVLYPQLRLRAYLQDGSLFTPPQLKRWQIYYQEVPELALNPNRHFYLNKDTLAEGETLFMEMAIENIGNVNADSVLVDFYLYDKNRVRHNISSPKYRSLTPGDTLIAKVAINTGGYDGLNSLWIEANPRDDQPEQYHFNNLGEIPFRVNRDITNPILDVTFDGVHIMNGDIISGKPSILVKLKDENKFLALNDTSDWQVFVEDPDGTVTKLFFESVPCSGDGKIALRWCPANLPQNTFMIEHKPVFQKDGVYELWVQATDVSGNISGNNSYRIAFEIINKASITEVINYPNPFSTSTKFVFTLTGSEIPEAFKIQIMTVTGKVIREINRDELGPIHIGRNITEFAWNGKDEFGDQLANGVYLYRVLTKLNGNNIEKRETDADQFFTKGWGKMYLMR